MLRPGDANEDARDEGWAPRPESRARAGCREEAGGRTLILIAIVAAVIINNIITIDIDITFNKGVSTCISHAGADVTSPPRRFRKNLYHEIREARRARASAEGSHPPQSRAAIGPFFDRRWTVATSV